MGKTGTIACIFYILSKGQQLREVATASSLHGRLQSRQRINSFIVQIEILKATTGSRLQSRQRINSFIVKIEILKATTASRLQSRQRINSFIDYLRQLRRVDYRVDKGLIPL